MPIRRRRARSSSRSIDAELCASPTNAGGLKGEAWGPDFTLTRYPRHAQGGVEPARRCGRPKYRTKALYGELRRQMGDMFRALAAQKGSQVLEGHLMPDH